MEATPTQIINYFSEFKQNLVPQFQYTWGERQWRTLWEDIVSFYGREIGDPKSTHFMGAVVTMPARMCRGRGAGKRQATRRRRPG